MGVVCQHYREKPQILAPNITSLRQRRLLVKAMPDEHGIATQGASRTLVRTRREYLREAVVISLPVASYRKLPGLGAWGRHVGDLQERAHMREGRDKAWRNADTSTHAQRPPARHRHRFQTPPVSHWGLPWKYKT